MSRALVAFVAAASVLLAPLGGRLGELGARTAQAADKAKAREAYRSASKHYDLGEFAEALVDFKEAYRNFEEPSFLFNIGQCHRQLGQNELAVRFFRTYLNKLPDAPNRALVEDMIVKLEQELRDQRAAAKPAPPPTPAEPAPAPSVAPVTPAPVAPHQAVAPSPTPAAASLVATAPARPEKVPVYKKWWLWTTVGVVVVGVGLGVGLGIGLTRARDATASVDGPTLSPSFK